jgi:hypothetical protein
MLGKGALRIVNGANSRALFKRDGFATLRASLGGKGDGFATLRASCRELDKLTAGHCVSSKNRGELRIIPVGLPLGMGSLALEAMESVATHKPQFSR